MAPEARGFSATVSNPSGQVETWYVAVEELGLAQFYRFVLEDGTDWMVDGAELREALEPRREVRAA